ncbi:MAG: hypothetical protein RIB55_17555 [Nitratireductor sp.]
MSGRWKSLSAGLVLAATFLCAEALAMRNPFLNDLRSVSLACEGHRQGEWCEVAAAVVGEAVRAPVAVVPAAKLPLNPSGAPAVNDAWLVVEVAPHAGEFQVRLDWGSAMKMAGVDPGHALSRLADDVDMRDEKVWRKILAATPFVRKSGEK